MKLSIFTFTLLTLSACSKVSSNNVDPSTVYGQISVERGSSTTHVATTFYVGGSTGTVLTIDSPAGVVINGNPATASDDLINSTSYIANTPNSNPSISVVYTDKNGASYANDIPTPGDLSTANIPSQVSAASGFNFTITTHQAFAGETITVDLSAGAPGSGNTNVMGSTSGATSQTISLDSWSLRSFSSRNVTVAVCRTSYPDAAKPYPKGTSISVKSCAPNFNVWVTP